MAVLVQCRKHPQYMGQKKVRVRGGCDTCEVLYELVHGEVIISGQDWSELVAAEGRKGKVK